MGRRSTLTSSSIILVVFRPVAKPPKVMVAINLRNRREQQSLKIAERFHDVEELLGRYLAHQLASFTIDDLNHSFASFLVDLKLEPHKNIVEAGFVDWSLPEGEYQFSSVFQRRCGFVSPRRRASLSCSRISSNRPETKEIGRLRSTFIGSPSARWRRRCRKTAPPLPHLHSINR